MPRAKQKVQHQLSIVPAPQLFAPKTELDPIRLLADPSAPDSFVWLVSPELAKLWLEEKAINRKITRGDKRIPLYAKMMTDDDWHVAEPLLFNPQGRLCDGQHRLTALIAAGIAVKFWIITGVTEDAMIFLNSGKPRTQHQSMTIAGSDASVLEIAMIKALLNPVNSGWGTGVVRNLSMDRQLVADLFEKHKEAVRFVSKFYGKKKQFMCTFAPIRSVAIRAYYHVDREVLARFLCILDGGSAEGGCDNIPQDLMRLYSLSKGGKDAAALHSKATHAIKAFVAGKKIDQLQPVKSQPYPVEDFDKFHEESPNNKLARIKALK